MIPPFKTRANSAKIQVNCGEKLTSQRGKKTENQKKPTVSQATVIKLAAEDSANTREGGVGRALASQPNAHSVTRPIFLSWFSVQMAPHIVEGRVF